MEASEPAVIAPPVCLVTHILATRGVLPTRFGLDRKPGPVYGQVMATCSSGSVERFVIREVESDDLDDLHRLSQHLNSVNFPHDQEALRRRIRRAADGFQGKPEDPFRRTYLFVLESLSSRRIIGTSMIYAQHGHLDAPHIFFDVFQDERYSTTLDRHFTHTTLRMGFQYDGPTEIGALVLDPAHRSSGLGKPLSFVRFLFMAMYRPLFRDTVIAELMPPLTPDGRSKLWDHVGRRFTGLDYQEADKLSHANKEFIIALFPQAIHATLLPDEVAAEIGEVGGATQGVRRMLERIGFRYSSRIDPFDGGPHFEAPTDDITVVQNTQRYALSDRDVSSLEEEDFLQGRSTPGLERMLIGAGRSEPPFGFRATVGVARRVEERLAVSAHTRALLRVQTRAPVHAVSLA